MTLVIRICVLSFSLWLLGCASTPPKERWVSGGREVDSLALPELDYPSQELDQFAREIEGWLQQGEIDDVYASFSRNHFFERVRKGVDSHFLEFSVNELAAKAAFEMLDMPEEILEATLSYELYNIALVKVDEDRKQLIYRLEGPELVSYLAFDYLEYVEGEFILLDLHDYRIGYAASGYVVKALEVMYAEPTNLSARKRVEHLFSVMGSEVNQQSVLAAMKALPQSIQSFEFVRWAKMLTKSKLGEHEEALSIFRRLKLSSGRSGAGVSWQGLVLALDVENYSYALQMLDDLQQQLNDDAALTNYRAWCLYHLGQTQQAFQLARRSIMLDPEYETGYFFLAEMLMASQQPQAALTTYQLLRQRFGYEFNAEYFISRDYYDTLAPLPGFTQLYSP